MIEEPMTLGSPKSPSANRNYLANYLLGSSNTPHSGNPSASPYAHTRSPGSNSGTPHMTSPLERRKVTFSASSNDSSVFVLSGGSGQFSSPAVDRSFSGSKYPERSVADIQNSQQPKGPPVVSYFSPKPSNVQSFKSPPQNASFLDSTNVSSPWNPGKGASFLNASTASFLDNTNVSSPWNPKVSSTQKGEASFMDASKQEVSELDLWVTVFGFPASSASHVMQDFAITSTIVDHRFCNETNWMHLKLANKLQTLKALNKNGKIIGKNIMIGVVPCTDPSVLSEEGFGKLETSVLNHSVNGSLRDSTSRHMNRSQSSVLRPLSANLNTSINPSDINSSPLPTRHQSTLSRAVEYLFGN